MENETKNAAENNPLETLLSNKELLSRLSDIAKDLKTSIEDTAEPPPTESTEPPTEGSAIPASAPSADALSTALSDPALMAKLPEVMAALTSASGQKGAKKAPSDKRTALLLALRPYLSPSRCEAIDYITRIGKLGDMLKNLKLQ